MSRIIDYVDTYCEYDAIVERMGTLAILKRLTAYHDRVIELSAQMRQHDRELDAGLKRLGIEPATLEAYHSGPFMKYKAIRADFERQFKQLISELIPAAETELAASRRG
jgi:hypothetical protein